MRVRSVSDCPAIKTIAPGLVAFKNKMEETVTNFLILNWPDDEEQTTDS